MAEAKRRAPRIELMVLCYAMQRGVICWSCSAMISN